MNAVASIAGFMKRHVLGPSLIRRNPFFYDSARSLLDHGDAQDLAQRRAWVQSRLEHTLEQARRTAYGRKVNGGATLGTWPYLEKESLRNGQDSFITGNRWFSAPASTGGTTGIPLSLVRSLRGVVFEQACQDRLIEQLGADPRGRIAILRGDNIKDPSDLKPPHWLVTNGGRCMIFSSNVLRHETIADYARALNEFQPTLLCAYPTSLECLCRLLQQHDCGCAVAPGDAPALAAIIRRLAGEAPLRLGQGAHGRTLYEHKFTGDAALAGWDELLHSLPAGA